MPVVHVDLVNIEYAADFLQNCSSGSLYTIGGQQRIYVVRIDAVLVNDVIEVTASEVPYAGNVRPVGGDLYAISPLEDETHKVLAYSICAAACVIFLAFETVCDA